MSSLLALDHVVIAVRDLERTVADYTATGFTVVAGGRHPGRHTRNALVVFEDGAYIELIAYDAPSPEERWWRVLDAHGEGLVDFALLPRDLAATVAAARSRGLAGLVDRPGGRARPDGVRIEWQSARPSTSDLPFLCFDVTPRALRVPEGEVRRHANGALGISEVAVAVGDLPATLERYRAYLGPEAVDGEQVRLAGARITLREEPLRARGDGPGAVQLRFADSGRGEGGIEPLEVLLLR
ncbi:VOC family protein [Ramlibacter monticola]|uniref:VOC family protein n=1 Tax=Ramlibacter monticola TaxID=1926872 RepID=A0A937CUU8_9BURK|nr:VOC family protein [Ramlibacter monticola]